MNLVHVNNIYRRQRIHKITTFQILHFRTDKLKKFTVSCKIKDNSRKRDILTNHFTPVCFKVSI